MLGRNNAADARLMDRRDGETRVDEDNNEEVELMALLTIRMRVLREKVQMVSR